MVEYIFDFPFISITEDIPSISRAVNSTLIFLVIQVDAEIFRPLDISTLISYLPELCQFKYPIGNIIGMPYEFVRPAPIPMLRLSRSL